MTLSRRCTAMLTAAIAFAAMTGCWDRVEINNRGFVVGVSIDAQPVEEEEPSEAETETETQHAQNYRICYQIVVPGGQNGGEGSQSNAGYSNLCGRATSLSAFHQYATDKLSRPPFYDHLKVILVSDQVARRGTGFADMLDFFYPGRRRQAIHQDSGRQGRSRRSALCPLSERKPAGQRYRENSRQPQ
ncbi:Ger(x)C family spore germination protein [Cohnella rhizosphaerae]|uniref:Spore germination protein N-terminal domain-containing protein n=1 Tax=Cohnella rhizosphaerae TaxID=1457232 RepID=A0A9X4KQF6_9BACL|nr:hypothetical protein [Cohnella rhizosphaerae]MDG0808803.1 hypothetical protein [Cohnella rhizosphaerae]